MTGTAGHKTRLRLRLTAPAWTLLFVGALQAAGASDDPADEYRAVVEGRAAKIVEGMRLDDDGQASRVATLIADFYVALHTTHEQRDAKLATFSEEALAERETAVLDASHRAVVEAHRRFVARLSANLTPDQVEQVKDGLTYGVVPITYAGYQRLLPDLTDDQKRMILANLLEAREHAMDAGSADEKHTWFGKYKGRINNELSAAGIDLKQAERDLANRHSP